MPPPAQKPVRSGPRYPRASGPWQSEWQTVAEIVCSTGSALTAVAGLFETVQVYPERMRANLQATQGAVLSEKAAMLLAPKLGRDAAHGAVADAIKAAQQQQQPLEQILKIDLGGPEDYLGSSEVFRRKLLDEPE